MRVVVDMAQWLCWWVETFCAVVVKLVVESMKSLEQLMDTPLVRYIACCYFTDYDQWFIKQLNFWSCSTASHTVKESLKFVINTIYSHSLTSDVIFSFDPFCWTFESRYVLLFVFSLFRKKRGTFLANVNSSSRSLYVISGPSVVCLSSVCRLSSVVCNVGAPYSGDWNFRQYFYAMWYLGHLWPLYKNFTEIVPGELLRRGS